MVWSVHVCFYGKMNDFELSCMVLNENEIRDASSPLMTAEEALSSTAEGQPGETSGMAWHGCSLWE